MSDSWEKRKQALEEGYFQRQEKEALERLAKRKGDGPRISPVSGKAMTQRTIHGVVIDQCPDSGGVWLDAGELEQIIDMARREPPEEVTNFFSSLFKGFLGDKK